MLEHLVDAHGILLRRDAIAAGSTDDALKRAVRAGFLVRIRQGVYVLRSIWEDADSVSRHRLLLEPAVAVLDWYVRAGLTTLEALFDMYDQRMRAWPDSLRLRHVLGLTDGRAESVGETRTRLMLRAARVPAPIAQYEIQHPSGLVAGRVDFAWPQFKLMLEFDGMVKYHRFRRPGETIEQMVIREKQREDTLRELTGWVMIRITWADLARPEATVARILRAMRLAA